MRKMILAIIAVIAIPALALAQAADAKAKADQILKQARAAIGDEKKLKDLQSLTISGTSRRNAGERSIESELEIEMMMPDKIKKTTNQQFGTQISAVNGEQLWNDFIPAVGGPGGGAFVIRGGPGGPGGGPGGPGGANSPMAAYQQSQQRRELYQIMLSFALAAPASAKMEYAFVGEAPGPEGSKLNVIDGKGADGFTVRLYFNQENNQLIGLSYKAKQLRQAFGNRGPGGGPGGPGGRQGDGQGGQRQQAGQGGQPGQGAQAGQGGQRQQGGQRVERTPEEIERMMKEFQDRLEKAPEVDFRWAFADYKSVNGLNLPHRITKMEGTTPNEEWEISKIKVNQKLSPDKFVKKEKPPAGN